MDIETYFRIDKFTAKEYINDFDLHVSKLRCGYRRIELFLDKFKQKLRFFYGRKETF